MRVLKWAAGMVVAVLVAGCAGQAVVEDPVADPTTGDPSTLPCSHSEQRMVALDIAGPGRPTPEEAVAPYAVGTPVVVQQERGKAVVHVLGPDGDVVRIFEVTRHDDGWWPDGYTECMG